MILNKIKKYAKYATWMMTILICAHLLSSIFAYIDMAFESEYILSYISSFVLTAIALIACVNGILLLRGITKSESPFNRKNVNRLRLISIMLLIYEPIMYILNHVANLLHPEETVHVSFGWVVFMAGAVMVCVTMVFEYGVALQTQVDETL